MTFRDNTLYTWGEGDSIDPIDTEITRMKRYKTMGYFVIVVSDHGVKWASTVVQTLGLNNCVDLIMGTPKEFGC